MSQRRACVEAGPRGIVRLILCGRCGEYIFLDIPLTKVCVHCYASVSVRKAVCACGHVFDSKKRGPVATARKPKRVAVNIRRALESADETAARKAYELQCLQSKRAPET